MGSLVQKIDPKSPPSLARSNVVLLTCIQLIAKRVLRHARVYCRFWRLACRRANKLLKRATNKTAESQASFGLSRAALRNEQRVEECWLGHKLAM